LVNSLGGHIRIETPRDSMRTDIAIIFLRKIYYLWCQSKRMSRDDEPSESLRDARDEWQKSTTALERVNQVIKGISTPRTAAEIAEEALVSEPTARKHLRALVETGVASSFDGPSATTYARNEETVLYRRIRELSTEQSHDELLEGIERMKRQIATYREEYDAISPEDLATSLAADASDGAWEAVAEWRTTERNLHIAQAAINFGRARDLGAVTQ